MANAGAKELWRRIIAVKAALAGLAGCLVTGMIQAAPTRLGIIVENPAAAQAGDLLTVELSRQRDVVLLERAEINRAYSEQRLSAGTKDYLRLGQVLGADGLVILEAISSGTNQFLGLKFVAVKPGVVLRSERFTWFQANAPDWVSGITRHLAPLIPKASVLSKDAIPLSIVSLRSAVQSREAREVEREMTLLLAERLSREREVFVLERRRLQVLASEKELKGMEDSAFWNGSYLLEGTLDPEGYSRTNLVVRARLVSPRDGPPQNVELNCGRTNLLAGVEALAKQILAALKLKPEASAWNAADEAARYFADASWAYRWGLLSQSQAASEAAWALGLRTEPVAVLRLQSYADDGWPVYTWGRNNNIPELPDPALLPTLIRALELFSVDSTVAITNGNRLTFAWYDNGVRLFCKSLDTLDCFYHWAEFTHQYRSQVGEIRVLTRQLLGLLESNSPADPADLRKRYIHRRYGEITTRSELAMLQEAEWTKGGLIFERPEDSIPLFRSVLNRDYNPFGLPNIVAWDWNERKTVPMVTAQFIGELCTSTNPAERVGGLTLAVIKTPFYPESTFKEKENALVTALWDCRKWVLSSLEHARVLENVEKIVGEKYRDWDLHGHFNRESFANTRFRLEEEFLLSCTNFDSEQIWRSDAIYPTTDPQMPVEHARKLATAIEHLTASNRYAGPIRDRLLRQARLLPTITNSAPVAPLIPAAEPLMARFIRWNLPHAAKHPGRHPQIGRMIVRNNQLWTTVAFVGESEYFVQQCVSAGVDPLTGNCDEVIVPEPIRHWDTLFEVTESGLYLSAREHVERFRFASQNWEKIEVPVEDRASIYSLGKFLYLNTATSLLELNAETLTTRILASARRQPSENELDRLLNSDCYAYPRADGDLGIMAPKEFFVYQPETQTLKKGPARPVMLSGSSAYLRSRLFYPGGALLRTESPATYQVFAFWNGQSDVELLLEQFKPGAANNVRFGGEHVPEKARWRWPEGFDLSAARILAQGTNLWLLTPRKIWHKWNNTFAEPGQFSDARQATLFCFTGGTSAPLAVPIVFEPSGIEPFHPKPGGYSPGFRATDDIPFWLETPAGLVFSEPAAGGHWLIPLNAAKARLAVLDSKAPSDPNQNGDSNRDSTLKTQ